jgi:UDP-N-acetylglucosamine:LPS N-acetylglucosamine transferase
MEDLIGASSVVVTKAGPSTIMESLQLLCPVIITQAVGLQEQGNIEFVAKHDLGFYCPSTHDVAYTIRKLSQPHFYRSVVAELQRAKAELGNGSAEIASLLMRRVDLFPVTEKF